MRLRTLTRLERIYHESGTTPGLPVKFVLAPCYGSEYCHMQHGCAYFTAKSFSNNSSESLAPSSDNHTDLFFVAGFEI